MVTANHKIEFYYKNSLTNFTTSEKEKILQRLTDLLNKKSFGTFIDKCKIAHLKTMSMTDYDTSRFIIPYNKSVSEAYATQYVNASFIPTNFGKTIIAAQLPKPKYHQIFEDFIVKSKTDLIVTLMHLDKNEDYFSSDQIYWVNKIQKSNIDQNNIWSDVTYSINGQKTRRLTLHTWVDMSAPIYEHFESFFYHLLSVDFKTMVVHCFAGIGRTGTLLLCYLAAVLKTKHNSDLAILTSFLRSQRPFMIVKEEQMRFAYEFIQSMYRIDHN